MAKVTAPLMSFTARNQIAKTLVYFPWKGIQAVRKYVIPANPRTALQIAQRNRMTAAVAEWHTPGYNTLDAVAWDRYAATLAKIMSGFNSMIRSFVKESILGNVWESISDCVVSVVGANAFTVTVTKESAGNAPTVRYGTSPTFMPNTEAMADQTGNEWEATLSGLTANTDYYFWIDVGASTTDYGRLGIYKQKTTA